MNDFDVFDLLSQANSGETFPFLILKGLKIQTFGHLVIDGLHSDCRLDHGSKSRATYKS